MSWARVSTKSLQSGTLAETAKRCGLFLMEAMWMRRL